MKLKNERQWAIHYDPLGDLNGVFLGNDELECGMRSGSYSAETIIRPRMKFTFRGNGYTPSQRLIVGYDNEWCFLYDKRHGNVYIKVRYSAHPDMPFGYLGRIWNSPDHEKYTLSTDEFLRIRKMSKLARKEFAARIGYSYDTVASAEDGARITPKLTKCIIREFGHLLT